MPPTNRKSLYPETSIPYTVYLNSPFQEEPPQLDNNLDSLDLNPKPTFLKVGLISQSKGSAYLEYGKTKIVAAVLPPREINKFAKRCVLGTISCELKYAPFASHDRTANFQKKEQFLSVALRKALSPVICLQHFPNFQIDVLVYVLHDDGCVLSSAINCCGAALVQGGIPVFDIVTASTFCILDRHIFVNPSASEEDLVQQAIDDGKITEHGLCVVATLSVFDQVAECYQKGYMSFETVEKLTKSAVTVNQSILDTVKHVLVNKVKKHLK